jgi:hypothetical protein
MGMKVPFPGKKHADEYSSAVQKTISAVYQRQVRELLDPRNVQRFYHGRNWRAHSGDEHAKEESTLEQHQVDHEIKFDDVIQHKLDLIPLTIKSITTSMHSSLMKMLYGKINESTDRSGNVVHAAEHGSPRDAFLETIRKIEFGVDEQGLVSLPQIHVPPGSRLLEELQTGGAAFDAQVEALIAEKSKAALERENERLARFKGET